MQINLQFRLLVTCHLRMAVMHLPTNFGAKIYTQFGILTSTAILVFQVM